jgi:hypothetical protein
VRIPLLCLLLLLTTAASPQDRPLPDLQAFLHETRARLQPDGLRQSGYVYVETRREEKLDASGLPTEETVQVFESYPGLPGEPRWKRLIQDNGVPKPAADLARQDRERQARVTAYARRLERAPDGLRSEEARDREKERRELEAIIDDVLRIYDIRMLGREAFGGHGTIMLSFAPRPGAQPNTREGKWLRNFAGKAWVSESEYELVRLETEAQDAIGIGLGLLARVHKGSRAEFERRKVDGDQWLPVRASYTASARLLLVRQLRMHRISEYSDYRRYSPDPRPK